MSDQLFPKPPKRKKQPTAEMLREQLRLAANEIIRLRAPWWRRWFAARWRWDPDCRPPPGPPFRNPTHPPPYTPVRVNRVTPP